ncbi:hypothetical protein BDY21DRAFT_354722 [Lineolata rhizophorae]|uniref:Uncharacterized protein n=1 Tax=Lineolata rhizophorae TaxID=578093 RepID=A0A6A6NQG7_9PEZI|nr:hypothetical protein BDY21DRAFT_354722 [Lineolata rhizophorae]
MVRTHPELSVSAFPRYPLPALLVSHRSPHAYPGGSGPGVVREDARWDGHRAVVRTSHAYTRRALRDSLRETADGGGVRNGAGDMGMPYADICSRSSPHGPTFTRLGMWGWVGCGVRGAGRGWGCGAAAPKQLGKQRSLLGTRRLAKHQPEFVRSNAWS